MLNDQHGRAVIAPESAMVDWRIDRKRFSGAQGVGAVLPRSRSALGCAIVNWNMPYSGIPEKCGLH